MLHVFRQASGQSLPDRFSCFSGQFPGGLPSLKFYFFLYILRVPNPPSNGLFRKRIFTSRFYGCWTGHDLLVPSNEFSSSLPTRNSELRVVNKMILFLKSGFFLALRKSENTVVLYSGERLASCNITKPPKARLAQNRLKKAQTTNFLLQKMKAPPAQGGANCTPLSVPDKASWSKSCHIFYLTIFLSSIICFSLRGELVS